MDGVIRCKKCGIDFETLATLPSKTCPTHAKIPISLLLKDVPSDRRTAYLHGLWEADWMIT